MLRDSMVANSPYLEDSVKDLLAEDALFDQNERRSVHREFLMRPVLLELRETKQSIEGFSRNLSYLGISLITRLPIPAGTIAKIHVYRLKSSASLFMAECRWTASFGSHWHMTGWNFMNVDCAIRAEATK